MADYYWLVMASYFSSKDETAGVKKRERLERRQQVAGELIQDFAQNTTLHGLRYIAEKRLSLIEK